MEHIQGQLPLDQLIELRKAHDIRLLKICNRCAYLGMSTRMIKSERVYFHGRCYADEYGIAELLALPTIETDKLCIGDIGIQLMSKILVSRMDLD